MPLSIAANISLPSLPRFLSPSGMVRRPEERTAAEGVQDLGQLGANALALARGENDDF